MSREQHLKISCFILRLFLQEILKDGRIETSEKEGFQALVQKLGIPAELAKKEFDSVKSRMVANPEKGAIDYGAFFTEVHDNLQKVIPDPDGVSKILVQVAALLNAETDLASFLSSMTAVKASPVEPVKLPNSVHVEDDSHLKAEIPPTVEPENGLISEGQTRDLGDGLYDLAKDIIHNGFEINDKDLTGAGIFKGGE